jgi:hypothetical protein
LEVAHRLLLLRPQARANRCSACRRDRLLRE